MNSVVLVESQGSCALVRIVRLQKFDRSRGQRDLHSPPQPIDWREHTIGAVHDRNLPTRSLQVPESYENFLWHRVKVRSIVAGLRHDDERDDDRSHRRVSIMSSLDAGWFRLITNILIQSRDLAMIARWHQCGTMTSQMLARASFPPSVWPSSRSNFDLGPSPSDSTEKLYHIRAYDFGVQFSFKSSTTRSYWALFLGRWSPFLFILCNRFWYYFDSFVRYWLSTRCPLLAYALLTWATVWWQLSLFVAMAAGLSCDTCFTAGCHVKSLPRHPPPPTPSQTEA